MLGMLYWCWRVNSSFAVGDCERSQPQALYWSFSFQTPKSTWTFWWGGDRGAIKHPLSVQWALLHHTLSAHQCACESLVGCRGSRLHQSVIISYNVDSASQGQKEVKMGWKTQNDCAMWAAVRLRGQFTLVPPVKHSNVFVMYFDQFKT